MPAELEERCGTTRILVVEDDKAVLATLKTILEKAGYEVVTAEDGFAAGATLMEQRPVLMILDLRLPHLDGMEVLKYVRNKPELTPTRVLVITGGGRERLQEALDAGADAGLEKPFGNHALLDEVKALIG